MHSVAACAPFNRTLTSKTRCILRSSIVSTFFGANVVADRRVSAGARKMLADRCAFSDGPPRTSSVKERMYQIDVSVTRAINSLAGHSGTADFLFIWVSAIGIPVMVAAVALQWWQKGDRSQTRYVLVSSGLSFLLGLAINQLVLLFVHRIRPYDVGVTKLLIARSADPSFPSDHATASIAIAAAFFLHRMPGMGTIYLAVATLIMFSRVFIGIHYLGDVVGGALTGLVAASLVLLFYRENARLNRTITSIL